LRDWRSRIICPIGVGITDPKGEYRGKIRAFFDAYLDPAKRGRPPKSWLCANRNANRVRLFAYLARFKTCQHLAKRDRVARVIGTRQGETLDAMPVLVVEEAT
jgi:hypothetical protein